MHSQVHPWREWGLTNVSAYLNNFIMGNSRVATEVRKLFFHCVTPPPKGQVSAIMPLNCIPLSTANPIPFLFIVENFVYIQTKNFPARFVVCMFVVGDIHIESPRRHVTPPHPLSISYWFTTTNFPILYLIYLTTLFLLY